MSIQHKELRGDLVVTATVAATAAGTAVAVPIIKLPAKALITDITFVPGAAITANGTNFHTLSVRNRTTGAGTVVMATRAWSATNSVATTPETLSLSGTASDLQAAAGDLLTAEWTHAASGLAIPAGLVQVTYRWR